MMMMDLVLMTSTAMTREFTTTIKWMSENMRIVQNTQTIRTLTLNCVYLHGHILQSQPVTNTDTS